MLEIMQRKMTFNSERTCFGNTSALTRHTPHCKTSTVENLLSTSSIRFECPRCQKTFSSKGYLKQHQLNSNCCKRVAEESIALALSETNSSTDSLKCNGCNKEFAQKNGLSSHRNFCQGLTSGDVSGPSNQSKVDNTVSEQSNLSATVHGANPLQCPKCTRVFKNKGGLTTHKKYCTKDGDKSNTLSTEKSVTVNSISEMSLTLETEKSAIDDRKSTTLDSEKSDNLDSEKPATQAQKSSIEKSATQAENSAIFDHEKSATLNSEKSVTVDSVTQASTISVNPDLKCSFCPKICKNKGSLASHKKACQIRKNPGSLKTRRRLSKSLNVGNRLMEDDLGRRLSTTLLIQEVRYLNMKKNS